MVEDKATIFTKVVGTIGNGYGILKQSRTLLSDTATLEAYYWGLQTIGYGLLANTTRGTKVDTATVASYIRSTIVATTPTLDQVLIAGNQTKKSIFIGTAHTGSSYKSVQMDINIPDSSGYFYIGDTIAAGTHYIEQTMHASNPKITMANSTYGLQMIVDAGTNNHYKAYTSNDNSYYRADYFWHQNLGAGTTNYVRFPAVNSVDSFTGGTGEIMKADNGLTVGDIPFVDVAGKTYSNLHVGTNGYVLTLAGGLPTWAAGGGGGSFLDTLVFSVNKNGAGGIITIGDTFVVHCQFAGTLLRYLVFSNNGISGSMAWDVLRSGSSIVGGGGNYPTLTTANTSGQVALSGWTSVQVRPDDYLYFVPTSVSGGLTNATVQLIYGKN